LHGNWRSSAEEALYDALCAGQAAQRAEGSEEVILKPFASIQVQTPIYGAGA
jgi:hypothetical protein